jgi:hypothetical protein
MHHNFPHIPEIPVFPAILSITPQGELMRFRTIAVAFIALAIFAAPAVKAPNQPHATATVSENVNCKYGQCHATAKSTGMQCKHCVSNLGDRFCWQHKD